MLAFLQRQGGEGMITKKTLCIAALTVAAALSVLADTPKAWEFDLTYSVKVGELPQNAHRVDVWLPYPVSDEHQDVQVTEVKSPYPHEVAKDSKYGNSILH